MPIISIHFMKWSRSLLQARSEQMGGMTPTPAIAVTRGPCFASCLCPLLSFQQSFRWSHRKVPCLSPEKENVSTGETGARAGSFYLCLLGAICLVWRKKIIRSTLLCSFLSIFSPTCAYLHSFPMYLGGLPKLSQA